MKTYGAVGLYVHL